MSGTAQKTQNGGDLAVSHTLQNLPILPHDTSANPDSRPACPDFNAAVNFLIRKIPPGAGVSRKLGPSEPPTDDLDGGAHCCTKVNHFNRLDEKVVHLSNSRSPALTNQ